MQTDPSHSAATSSNLVRLGGNHGYRFEGDTAILNAELERISGNDLNAPSNALWALQLWACDVPYEGGQLRGLKVAETPLASFSGQSTWLETSTLAQLPRAQSEYNMVLVLASGDHGRYDRVQDFSNYAQRQQFEGPVLEGTVGYRFDGEGVLLQADRVRNTRAQDNLSGSLTLELWALPEAYQGGELRGTILASTDLGRLEGQAEERFVERYASRNPAPAGNWHLAVVLTEFTSSGYVTRDFSTFATPYIVESPLVAESSTVASQQLSHDTAHQKPEPAASPTETLKLVAPVTKQTEAPKTAAAAAPIVVKASEPTKPAAVPVAAPVATKEAEAAKTAPVAAPVTAPVAVKQTEAAKAAPVSAKETEAAKAAPVAGKEAEAAKTAEAVTTAVSSKDADKLAAKEADATKLTVVLSKEASATKVTGSVSQN